MSLTVEQGGDFEKCPIGAHAAWCVSLIDLGTQRNEYMGEEQVKKKVWIMWEVPGEHMKDGRPFGVSAFYTASLNEKANLRKDLESWRGRPFTPEELDHFDLKNIVGKPCMINVIHTDKGKVQVSSIMQLPKGMTIDKCTNSLMVFDIDAWDQNVFENVPQGIQKIIYQSSEYKVMSTVADKSGCVSIPSSEIPF